MPFYDYVYGTLDKSTDTLHEKSLERKDETPDVVYLTHLTTPESIYHMRLGFASVASKPYTSPKWYLRMLWPITLWSMLVTWIYGKTFVVERNIFKKVKIQTWAVPKYKIQVCIRIFRAFYITCYLFKYKYLRFAYLVLQVFHGMAKRSNQ